MSNTNNKDLIIENTDRETINLLSPNPEKTMEYVDKYSEYDIKDIEGIYAERFKNKKLNEEELSELIAIDFVIRKKMPGKYDYYDELLKEGKDCLGRIVVEGMGNE